MQRALDVRSLLLLSMVAVPAFAKDIPVGDEAALQAALGSARPGDNLILTDGEWRDVSLVFAGQGATSEPITLKAATPGKVVVTGRSTLRIGGEHLVVEGLCFQCLAPEISDPIQFRLNPMQLAQRCRITNCAMIGMGNSSRESRWLGLYGMGHRVDHCTFRDKTGKGATMVVWLGNGSEGAHRIDHNYFGPRERLGSNGGETIRIGDSQTSLLRGGCVVEQNLFEKCNGEAECISNKSCGNIYRENTFLEVSGALSLRHGNGCMVERNVFLGNGARGTGGIRIIGEDHTVRGNYLERLTGDDARAGLCLMMGIPNSPANRYFQVQRAVVEDNTLVDCEHPILIGLSDDEQASLPPVDCVFCGNQVLSPKHAIVEVRCTLDGIAWRENRFAGKALGIPAVAGIETSAPEPVPLPPIPRASVGPTW